MHLVKGYTMVALLPTGLGPNHKGGDLCEEYIFLGCTGLQTLGEAFLFNVWEMGEVNVLVYGKKGGGWGHNTKIYI